MSLHRRLRALERGTKRGDGVLVLKGGATVRVQLSDPLGLTLAAMRRQYGRMSGQPTESRFDRTLDLLERAIDVSPESPPLLEVAWSALQGSHDAEDLNAPDTIN